MSTKVKETATFIFALDGQLSKDNAYKELRRFLSQNDWLDARGMNKEPLRSYHSENDGSCQIILSEEKSNEDFTDQIDDLFESLQDNDKVKWIKVRYNKNTRKIVYEQAGIYLSHQSVALSDVKENDEVVVYIKK